MVNLWPFQKNFSDIPCAREAAIAGMTGGIGLGASSIIIMNRYKYAFKTSVYGGFVVFWVAFLSCRYQYAKTKDLSKQFIDSMARGDVD